MNLIDATIDPDSGRPNWRRYPSVPTTPIPLFTCDNCGKKAWPWDCSNYLLPADEDGYREQSWVCDPCAAIRTDLDYVEGG